MQSHGRAITAVGLRTAVNIAVETSKHSSSVLRRHRQRLFCFVFAFYSCLTPPTTLVPCLREKAALDCRWYRFKPTLQEDMARADVVISHAGAGSVMEALGEPCQNHPSIK